MLASAVLLVVVSLQGCLAFSGGPPPSVCSTLRPMHPGDPSSGNGGYVITTNIPMNMAESGYEYVPNTTYTVTLRGTTNTFRGFAVRGVSIVDESPLGSFVPGANQQLLGCSPPDYTIVHNNPAPGTMDFTEQSFMWQAPSEEGEVDFRYSVVRYRMNTGEYYVGLSALGREPGTGTPVVTGFNPMEAGVTEPAIAPHNYRLMIKEPSSCNVSDCSVFVGIDTNRGNDEFLNVYMEANAKAWVAVGFSNSANMFSADVLACNLRPDGVVEVLDTWNLDEGRGNVRDEVDDTLIFPSSSMVDGRIKCSFVRSIAGTGDTQDLNLNDDYYVLFGRSDGEQSSGFIRSHRNGGDRNPFITEGRINATGDSGVFSAGNSEEIRRALIQTHGIFMLIAWPLLATFGVFFASSMRCFFKKKGTWFQIHRVLMVSSLFVGAAGFVFAFFSQLNSATPGLIELDTGSPLLRARIAHFIFGIVVMALHIVNPIIAIFRCHPGEKNRWIFDIVHGFPGVGATAWTLAIINVAIGLVIFSNDFSRFGNGTLFWVFFGFAISLLSQYLMGSFFRLPLKIKGWQDLGKEEADDFAVKMDKSANVEITGQKKAPSCKGSCESKAERNAWSWFWYGLFFAFMAIDVIIVITLIVLVALPL